MNKRPKRWKWAWKVFFKDGCFEYYAHDGLSKVQTGLWLKSKSGPGFFSFPSRHNAMRWLDTGQDKEIKRVRVAGITKIGVLRAYVANLLTETYPICQLSDWLYVPRQRRKP